MVGPEAEATHRLRSKCAEGGWLGALDMENCAVALGRTRHEGAMGYEGLRLREGVTSKQSK